VDGSAGVESRGGDDVAALRIERDEQGVTERGEIRGGRVDDVAVPARHVAGAEGAVDGVEHHGSRTVEICRARSPDAVVTHLHSLCIKPPESIGRVRSARRGRGELTPPRTTWNLPT
jgi:hypothetical protein